MTVQPMIGQWYHYPEKAQKFFVTALDIDSDNVEIQYFDGAIDEMDVTTWYDSYIQIVEAPEDWTGSMDFLEIDDRSSTGTEMSKEDWEAPYDEVMEKEHAASHEDYLQKEA